MVDLSAHPAPSRTRSASDALGLWEPKRTLTLAAARAHTARVQFIRHALIAASVALAVVLGIYFITQSDTAEIYDDPDTSVRMINPRYSGRTSDNLPFYLTAQTATRQLESRNEVALVEPVLEFIRADGAESSFVLAETGQYDDVGKVLDLRTDVDLQTDDGYVCQTSHARIFARDKRIEGDEPITCTGNFGTIDGQTYEVRDNYRTFVFKDGMTGLIEQDTDGSGADGAFGFGGDGPIDVAARTATYYGGTTDLSGDVVVKQEGATVYSDDMTILRDQAQNRAAGTLQLGAVQRIIGTGNFRYVSADNDVRGERGVYERDTGVMTVTGNVRVVQPGGNTVSTDRLTYDTRTDTIRFSGNCRGRGCEGNSGRVNIRIKEQ